MTAESSAVRHGCDVCHPRKHHRIPHAWYSTEGHSGLHTVDDHFSILADELWAFVPQKEAGEPPSPATRDIKI